MFYFVVSSDYWYAHLQCPLVVVAFYKKKKILICISVTPRPNCAKKRDLRFKKDDAQKHNFVLIYVLAQEHVKNIKEGFSRKKKKRIPLR